MPTIRQLSPSVVNKIAAGEVIERPASVREGAAGESVDAGATRIDVTVEKGGIELIRVVDDGCGIAADICRWRSRAMRRAKFVRPTICFRLDLGFAAKRWHRSRRSAAWWFEAGRRMRDDGAELEVVGGAASRSRRSAVRWARRSRCGTCFSTRRCGTSLCARRKRRWGTRRGGDAVGAGSSADSFHACAQRADGARFAAGDRLRRRIAAFFGGNWPMISSRSRENDGIKLSGFVANPMHSRATGRMQYLFLNGRAIRDRALQHASARRIADCCSRGDPICFLRLEMPAERWR